MLTSEKNRAIDAAALAGLLPAGRLKDCALPSLEKLVLKEPGAATTHLATATRLVSDHWDGLSSVQQDSWYDALLLASSLVANSLLWAPVRARPGERMVVKVGYEHPVDRDLLLKRRVLTALNWAPYRLRLPFPNIGDGGSFHIQVEPPPGTRIHRSRLLLTDPLELPSRRARGSWGERLRQRWHDLAWTAWNTGRAALVALFGRGPGPQETDEKPPHGEAFSWDTDGTAYLYVAGERKHVGRATVDLAPAGHGSTGSALLAAGIISALLVALSRLASEATAHVDATVTLLLLVPALLGYLVVQPGEHPVTRSLLYGVRGLVLLAGAMPIAAAAALVGHAHPLAADVRRLWLWLGVGSGLATLLLAVSWLGPVVTKRVSWRGGR